ncbi:BppU family phage baseplate upper protein [Enterococcus avium]|uniref:BppU family phage baseplate upper protein n=1 Tax=Enterococcus avium TaxID=33945 RepID=UPI002891AD9F|nr:BppU family phage baseplate upper protein [Enterococcus avium]MDT2550008.1 BppU family phage baseplate upper protein [Enterococcus avium]
MANLEIKLSASKRQMYSRQRVVGRVGDGGLTTIGVQLLEADESTPFLVNQSGSLKFVGINSNGDYTEGIPDLIDGSNGIISYTFSKENFAVSNKFQRAYFEYTDPSGSKVTFQDFVVDVLQRADISAEQAEYYISSLESLLANMQVDFDKFIADSTVTYDVFYQKYNELIVLINSAELKANSVISKVDSALVEFEAGDFFNKQESSANVIYQIIGKENFEMAFTMDFKEKVKGSVNENPNTLFGLGTTTLPRPSEMTTEVVQERYTAISEMDGNTVNSTITDNAYFPKFGAKWNLVEHVKKVLGEEYFLTLGAATLAQQVALLRTKITSLSGNSYGYGHSPSGYKISMGSWLRTTNTWESVVSHASDTISKLTIDIDKPLISNYIDDNGFFYTLVYSDPSDGKTATKVVTDYTNVVFTMEISANEHIKSMIAANHRENLATQDEAEEGLNESKTMTPVRVFQAIAKWIANKFVSVAGNETILGIKNFTGGLLVSDKRVLTVDDILQTSGTIPLINGNTGVLKYTKQLKNVTLTFNGLNGKYGGTPSGSTLANLPTDLRPANYFEELVGSTDRGAVNTAALSFATTGEIKWQRNSSTASDYSFEVTYQTI